MVVEINLKLIKPSKEIRLATFAYDNIAALRIYSSKYRVDGILRLFSCINKDWETVLNSNFEYRDLMDRVILNQKLTSKQQKVMSALGRLVKVKPNSQIEKILNKELIEYKENYLKKIIPELNKLYTPTKVNLKIFSASSKTNYCGSATRYSFYLSSDNLETTKKRAAEKQNTWLITHEIVHTINSENPIYNKIIKGMSKTFEFSEILTQTIANIVTYKLKIKKDRWYAYRFPLNKADCDFEDELRKHYDAWEKLKTKNKPKFIEYLNKQL